MILTKIISGGQTGVDRAALEVAEALGIPTGGWVPAGCWTDEGQDFTLVTRFGCTEHASPAWAPRTRQNVLDADGTVWFGAKSPGYWCTYNAQRAKPVVRDILRSPVAFTDQPPDWLENPATPEELANWVRRLQIRTLNVAGNRARTHPKSATMATVVLTAAIARLRGEL